MVRFHLSRLLHNQPAFEQEAFHLAKQKWEDGNSYLQFNADGTGSMLVYLNNKIVQDVTFTWSDFSNSYGHFLTLTLHSKQDKYSLPEEVIEVYNKCHSQKSIVWFEKGNHSHIRIANEEKYDFAIRNFISELP